MHRKTYTRTQKLTSSKRLASRLLKSTPRLPNLSFLTSSSFSAASFLGLEMKSMPVPVLSAIIWARSRTRWVSATCARNRKIGISKKKKKKMEWKTKNITHTHKTRHHALTIDWQFTRGSRDAQKICTSTHGEKKLKWKKKLAHTKTRVFTYNILRIYILPLVRLLS